MIAENIESKLRIGSIIAVTLFLVIGCSANQEKPKVRTNGVVIAASEAPPQVAIVLEAFGLPSPDSFERIEKYFDNAAGIELGFTAEDRMFVRARWFKDSGKVSLTITRLDHHLDSAASNDETVIARDLGRLNRKYAEEFTSQKQAPSADRNKRLVVDYIGMNLSIRCAYYRNGHLANCLWTPSASFDMSKFGRKP